MSDSTTALDPARLPPLSELQTTRMQVEKELEFLSASHSQLTEAKSKCNDNITMIEHIREIPVGQTMMASITNSMFIPVTLKSNDRITTDIGTGFMVERDGPDAQQYFQRKIDTIVDNIKKVEGALLNKQNALKFLNEAMRVKMEAEQAGTAASK